MSQLAEDARALMVATADMAGDQVEAARKRLGAALDGGNGESFDFKTTDPYRDSVFAGAGVTAQFGKNLSGSVFYNINFGSQTYQSNMVSAGLNFSF